MFSSSSNNNYPFNFVTNQSIQAGPSFAADEHPNPTDQDQPSPFLHFPVPFLVDDDEFLMSQLLPQPEILGSSCTPDANYTEINCIVSPRKDSKKEEATTRKKRSTGAGNGAKQATPRKRTGKKDRHSKIYTAQGPRDRRMRLSLQIARKFFDLQDILGFDKASKTIEWLFSKSKTAIKELTESLPRVKHSYSDGAKSASSTSESEVVSGGVFKENYQENGQYNRDMARGENFEGKPSDSKNKKSRKAAEFNPIAKESRDKARARARERTREKMKMKGLDQKSSNQCSDHEANPNDLEQFGSPSPLETGENLGCCKQEMSSSMKVAGEEELEPGTVHLLEHQMDSVSIIEKFLGIASGPRSSTIFNYSHSMGDSSEANYPEFTGNWTLNNNRVHYNFCAMRNMKGSNSTGNVQMQNPNEISITKPNAQEQNTSSLVMMDSTIKEPNSPSAFVYHSNAHERNPSSIPVTSSQSPFPENHFYQNSNYVNK